MFPQTEIFKHFDIHNPGRCSDRIRSVTCELGRLHAVKSSPHALYAGEMHAKNRASDNCTEETEQFFFFDVRVFIIDFQQDLMIDN